MTDGVARRAWPLVRASEMQALDRHAIEGLGVPGALLMESAGRAVTAVVLERLRPADSVLVVCGRGNNGGDGLVVARHLQLLGVPVRAAVLTGTSPLTGDTAANLERARAAGVSFDAENWQAPDRGVMVDALFGTGLTRDVEGPAKTAIQRINASRDHAGDALRVIAVDLPSGLDADAGQALGSCVRADTTVTIGLPKLGLVLEPGRSQAGRILVARIGIPDAAPGLSLSASLWTRAGAGAALPARPRAGHKGTFGHALVVAGSEGKTGAAALAAEGAGRSGAGLVTLACPAGLNDILEVKCTEAMTAPLPDTDARAFAASAKEQLMELAASRDAVGLGPGIGQAQETAAFVRAVAPRLALPLAIDADGLTAFVEAPELLAARRAATVLTPHPGEAARLLGISAAEVNRDRPAAACRLAERTGSVVLLKGAASITAAPGGRLVVNPTGGPALGSGGTGDLLLGLVTGFLAQGEAAFEAAALAAYVHGFAADRLAARQGEAGLLAGELGRAIPAAVDALRAAATTSTCERRLAVPFPEP